MQEFLLLLAMGLIAGIVGGTLGVGGGIVIVPALIFILGFNQHQAQGTSIAFMLPPIGILAAYNYYKSGYVDIKVALILTIAFVIGAYFGSMISVSLPDKILKKIFGAFMLFVALKMIFEK
ncbi:sulfite exporter TauE/SafE family protein [Ancylomarina longa]|uniref:Probable membrane transporter protein n=1 Tax=Ancylomarina longa TaxID=2487017 RepID=A0A434AVU1_9BACT|nr:sulfite exporter TauE/SafE family protein [Ancylomarina longa]RUT78496.1 sulfite exporter TauE/SafE family protein [Ancylomarina longa]